MRSFKITQIFAALCLMASLLIGHASACSCPHHEEEMTVENDCHSQHRSADNIEISDRKSIDETCICVAEQPSPYVTSRSTGKDFSSNDAIAGPELASAYPGFISVITSGTSPARFTKDLSYSNTLRSLLPSRAPPRL